MFYMYDISNILLSETLLRSSKPSHAWPWRDFWQFRTSIKGFYKIRLFWVGEINLNFPNEMIPFVREIWNVTEAPALRAPSGLKASQVWQQRRAEQKQRCKKDLKLEGTYCGNATNLWNQRRHQLCENLCHNESVLYEFISTYVSLKTIGFNFTYSGDLWYFS